MSNSKVFAIILGSLVVLCLSTFGPVCALEDVWATKAPMVTIDGAAGAVTVNGKIYAFNAFATEEYDPQTDTWTQKSPMPTPRRHFGITVYQNKIYVIGGTLNSGGYTSKNEVYDPANDSWETKTAMPTKRIQLNAHTGDGKIYLIGGRIADNETTVYLNEVYDPALDLWTQKAPSPYAVTSYASTALDGKIYIFGGQSDPISTNVDITQIYDAANDSWSFGKSAPTIIWQAGAAATVGLAAPKRIYVMGGMTGFAKGLDQNLVYNPEMDTWANAAPLPYACYNPAVVVVEDKLYLIGGGQHLINTYKNNTQYTPLGYGTIQLTPTASPTHFPTPSTPPTPTLTATPMSSPSPTQQPTPSSTLTASPENTGGRIEVDTTIPIALGIVVLTVVVGLLAYFRKRR